MRFRLFTFTLLLSCLTIHGARCQEQPRAELVSGWGSGIVDGLYSRIQLYAGGELRVVKRIRLSTTPQALAFSPDDTVLAVETPLGVQFHAISGVLMGSAPLEVVPKPPFYSSSPTLAFAADMSAFLALRGGLLNVWKLASKPSTLDATRLWKLENVSAAVFSPDGKQVLLCQKLAPGFALSLVSTESGTAVWTRDIGFTPAIQLAILSDDAQARVVTCSVPNRFYPPTTLYERGAKPSVAATVTTWGLEQGQTLSSFGLPDYFPAPLVLSPQGNFVVYQSLEGGVVVDAANGTPMRSGLALQGSLTLSSDESTFSSMATFARFSQYPNTIVGYPFEIVADSSRHQLVPPCALSSDGTYWAVTAGTVPFVGNRTLSSPTVLIWEVSP